MRLTTTTIAPRILPRLAVPARDGVVLCTDVFLPETAEPRPAVLVRTPYGRNRPFLLQLAQRLSDAGLCAVLQDCRGRYQSGGIFDLMREESDSHDTLAWLAGQEWTTGEVGVVGVSIATFSNFLAAAREVPEGISIKALISVMGVVDCHTVFFRDGALLLHWALPWVTLISDRHMGRMTWLELPWTEIFRHLPLATAAERTQGHARIWEELVSRPVSGGIWDRLNAMPALAELEVPCLHLAGWYDFLLNQSLMGFRAMAERRSRPPAPQQLVVGPWDHQTVFSSFGPERKPPGQTPEGTYLDLMQVVLSWFKRWLAEGEPAQRRNGAEQDVRLYVLHRDTWLRSDRFPLPGTVFRDLYLTSGGGANTARGDGRLVPGRPEEAGCDRFVYDPQDPVPTLGGGIWPFSPLRLQPGQSDQSAVEERADVLVYSGDPLAQDLTVVGPLEVELWAATSARDTDFTAKLVDVDPLGVARVVQDGVVRGRFHADPARESLLELHRPYRFAIDLQTVAYTFRAGHLLRLEISSSSFPKFDRNLNTSAEAFTGTASLVARQTVFHGAEMASRLRLPVLPSAALEALRWNPGTA